MSEVLNIERAEHVGAYQVRLQFNDGSQRVVDFGPFLMRSTNPLIRVYLEPKNFASFAVRQGDLVWGDYDMCFPIADLYEARI